MTQSSFRFHKFKENEKTSSTYYNKNLSYSFSPYNNNNNDIFQNSNKLSRSIYFENNQQNYIIQNKNKNERILHLDESNINLNSPFPEKEILKIPFKEILNHGDLKEIENYLPDLLNNKFDKSKGKDILRKVLENTRFSRRPCGNLQKRIDFAAKKGYDEDKK